MYKIYKPQPNKWQRRYWEKHHNHWQTDRYICSISKIHCNSYLCGPRHMHFDSLSDNSTNKWNVFDWHQHTGTIHTNTERQQMPNTGFMSWDWECTYNLARSHKQHTTFNHIKVWSTCTVLQYVKGREQNMRCTDNSQGKCQVSRMTNTSFLTTITKKLEYEAEKTEAESEWVKQSIMQNVMARAAHYYLEQYRGGRNMAKNWWQNAKCYMVNHVQCLQKTRTITSHTQHDGINT